MIRNYSAGYSIPFVGRTKEVADITARLVNPDCRLLTLTGLGGSGKTRLALEAASTVTTGVATQYDAESRPNFAAPIYSAPWEVAAVPTDARPLFIALANDDQMAVDASVPLYTKWRAASHPAELHIYAKGGHGFGMLKKGLPSDHWIEHFGEWLRGEGFGG